MTIKFRKEDPKVGCFSNFSPHRVVFGKREFPTSEHAFQFHKFARVAPEIAEQIAAARAPWEAKRIAKDNHDKADPAWFKGRSVCAMLEILFTKAHQHATVRAALAATGDEELVEFAPWDDFWGDGRDGKGLNILGRLWMVVRDTMRRTGTLDREPSSQIP